MKFLDNGEIVLRPNSQLVVKSYLYDADKPAQDNIAISLIKGGLRAVTGLVGKRNHDAVSFDTPTATIGIRGTNWGALYCQDDCGGQQSTGGKPLENGLYVDVAQGRIVVSNAAGMQEFAVGQFGFVASLNTLPVIVPPVQGFPMTMPLSISINAPADASQKPGELDCVVR